jgi:5-methyltetrahydrofolate--homocysteine methyltransferase
LNAYYSFNALSALDDNCAEYIAGVTEATAAVEQSNITLHTAIVKGLQSEAAQCTKELLETKESLEIINEYIIPALDEVGAGFEANKLFLPQLLMSADSAKAAFEVIREKLMMSGAQQESRGKIVLATVHGDIHDIGKNIVKVLLSNYGFEVIDLGKDVPEETVLKAVQDNGVKLVGLSALMTTTVPAMERTIELLHENTDAKIMVGGAVLTRHYAEMINADWYAKDAMDSVRIAQEFFK